MSEELNKKFDKILVEITGIKKKMATKEDLKEVRGEMATKEDLKQYATKEDLNKVLIEVLVNKEKLEKCATRDDLDKAVDKIITAVDGLAKKTDKVEIEQISNIVAHDRFEKRITKLESVKIGA